MTTISWKHGVDGDFGEAADWRGGAIPGSADVAVIGAGAAGVIDVTVTADQSVGAIRIGPAVTLDIQSGDLADPGVAPSTNAGTIAVGDGAALTIAGRMMNRRGVVALDGMQTRTSLIIAQAGADIQGGGVMMGASSAGIIHGVYGGSTAPVLTNAASIIGTGIIDNLAIANAGLIDAQGPFALTLTPGNVPESGGATISNTGTLQAGAAGVVGELALYSMTIANRGVVIARGAGSRVVLNAVTIEGGMLRIKGGGIIATGFGADVLDGRAAPVTNLASMEVPDSGLGVEGAIVNAGRIDLGGASAAGSLDILANASLSGGGRILLSADSANEIFSATGATLNNIDNTIAGAGYFDRGGPVDLTVVNGAGGVIDANGANANSYLDTLGLGNTSVVNDGLLETTNLGQLIITAAVDNQGTIRAAGGIIRVYGAISGAGTVIVDGGDLDLAEACSQDVKFRDDAGVLTLDQSQAYGGMVSGFSAVAGDTLHLTDITYTGPDEASFSGTRSGGTLTVSDGIHTAHIDLRGDYRASEFTTVRDSHGQVIVEASSAPVHRLTTAMAALGGALASIHSAMREADHRPETLLARPK